MDEEKAAQYYEDNFRKNQGFDYEEYKRANRKLK